MRLARLGALNLHFGGGKRPFVRRGTRGRNRQRASHNLAIANTGSNNIFAFFGGGSTSNRSRDREGVPYGPRRATKSDQDASGRPNRINGLRRVFKGVPYGPRRATKSDEDASGRPNRINGLRRVFKGADLAVADLPYFEAADFGFGDFAAHAGGFGG